MKACHNQQVVLNQQG